MKELFQFIMTGIHWMIDPDTPWGMTLMVLIGLGLLILQWRMGWVIKF